MSDNKSFDTTLTKLKTRGYWRVEFYPTEFDAKVVDGLLALKDLVRDASVHFRGWDMPHVPLNPDDKQGIYPKDSNRYESWIDWSEFKEVWRMYQSGKFTFLKGLNEHWYDEYQGFIAANPLPNLEPGTKVDIINVIYSLTEFMYFFHGLSGRLSEVKNWSIRVSLLNVEDNKLTILDPSRMPLHWDYVSHTKTIAVIDSAVSYADLKNTKTCLRIAKEGANQVFQNFEWQAADTLIEGEQDKLVSKRF
jgi:hypothetical protein